MALDGLTVEHESVLNGLQSENPILSPRATCYCFLLHSQESIARPAVVSVLSDRMLVSAQFTCPVESWMFEQIDSVVSATLRRMSTLESARHTRQQAQLDELMQQYVCRCCAGLSGEKELLLVQNQVYRSQERSSTLKQLQVSQDQGYACILNQLLPQSLGQQTQLIIHVEFPRAQWASSSTPPCVSLSETVPLAASVVTPRQARLAIESHLDEPPEHASCKSTSTVTSRRTLAMSYNPLPGDTSAYVVQDAGQASLSFLQSAHGIKFLPMNHTAMLGTASAEPLTGGGLADKITASLRPARVGAPPSGFDALVRSKEREQAGQRQMQIFRSALLSWGFHYHDEEQSEVQMDSSAKGTQHSAVALHSIDNGVGKSGSPDSGATASVPMLHSQIPSIAQFATNAERLLDELKNKSSTQPSCPQVSEMHFAIHDLGLRHGRLATASLQTALEIAAQSPEHSGKLEILRAVQQLWFVLRELISSECISAMDACFACGVQEISFLGTDEATLRNHAGVPQLVSASRPSSVEIDAAVANDNREKVFIENDSDSLGQTLHAVLDTSLRLRSALVRSGNADWNSVGRARSSNDATRCDSLRAAPLPSTWHAIAWYTHTVGALCALQVDDSTWGGAAGTDSSMDAFDVCTRIIVMCSRACDRLRECIAGSDTVSSCESAEIPARSTPATFLLQYCKAFTATQAARREWKDACRGEWLDWERSCSVAAAEGLILIHGISPTQSFVHSSRDSLREASASHVEARPTARSLGELDSSLVRPVQKACRYPLLAHAMSKAAGKVTQQIESGIAGQKFQDEVHAQAAVLLSEVRILTGAAQQLESDSAALAASVNRVASEVAQDRALNDLHARMVAGHATMPEFALPPHDVIAPGRRLEQAIEGHELIAVLWDRHQYPGQPSSGIHCSQLEERVLNWTNQASTQAVSKDGASVCVGQEKIHAKKPSKLAQRRMKQKALQSTMMVKPSGGVGGAEQNQIGVQEWIEPATPGTVRAVCGLFVLSPDVLLLCAASGSAREAAPAPSAGSMRRDAIGSDSDIGNPLALVTRISLSRCKPPRQPYRVPGFTSRDAPYAVDLFHGWSAVDSGREELSDAVSAATMSAVERLSFVFRERSEADAAFEMLRTWTAQFNHEYEGQGTVQESSSVDESPGTSTGRSQIDRADFAPGEMPDFEISPTKSEGGYRSRRSEASRHRREALAQLVGKLKKRTSL